MKVRLLSDLHLEFLPLEIGYFGADILILAGDISSKEKQTKKLIETYLSKNSNSSVIYVLGNHDYYKKSIQSTHEFWENVEMERFFYLQDDSVVINGIRFMELPYGQI